MNGATGSDEQPFNYNDICQWSKTSIPISIIILVIPYGSQIPGPGNPPPPSCNKTVVRKLNMGMVNPVMTMINR